MNKFMTWVFSDKPPPWVQVGAVLISSIVAVAWFLATLDAVISEGPWMIWVGVPTIGFVYYAYVAFREEKEGGEDDAE